MEIEREKIINLTIKRNKLLNSRKEYVKLKRDMHKEIYNKTQEINKLDKQINDLLLKYGLV